jgi:hypothetical protein
MIAEYLGFVVLISVRWMASSERTGRLDSATGIIVERAAVGRQLG